MDVREKIKTLPEKPGVYIMLDEFGQILYVGKAKNLRNRVRHYFLKSVKDEKTMRLVEKIKDFRYIIVPNEVEALVLENNLIKEHKPHYNILLKDDKTYPYIKVFLKEKFPHIEVTRKLRADGSRYFGPYMQGVSGAAVMNLLHAAFPLRSCRKDLQKKRKGERECLNYHLKRCLAPCTGRVTEEEYRAMIGEIIRFLQGDDNEVRDRLNKRMLEAAERQEFELAKEYRDNLHAYSLIARKQLNALPKDLNLDVFARVLTPFESAVTVMFIRGGKTLGLDTYPLSDAVSDDFSSFIMQYYTKNPVLADEIILSEKIEFDAEMKDYLSSRAGFKVNIVVPTMGVRKQLVDMALANTDEYLEKNAEKLERVRERTSGAVDELREVLGMARRPNRIECFDISNISGTDKVSSMVVFQDGQKAGDMYRKFKIKTVKGSDDFKSMAETLSRRMRLLKESKDRSFSMTPDLIVVDGGKGQLSAVREIVEKVPEITLISLAERFEEVYRPGKSEPLLLPKDGLALPLLQRIRDEAHRFAITYHRNLRGKRQTKSVLTNIEGVGASRARQLLLKMGSLEKIAAATAEELKSKANVPKNVAENIYRFYHEDVAAETEIVLQ